MEYFITIIVTSIAAMFAYGSTHVAEEQKQGKYIPLPWETINNNKVFDKSDIEYTDGDNT